MNDDTTQQGSQLFGQAGGQGQGTGQAPLPPEVEEDADLENFLSSTPPPEPRGAAYKGSSAFQMFTTIVKLPDHPLANFDEKYFLFLFAGSLSLSIDEKKDILFTKLPGLSQFQVDELVKILEEEKQKFDELASKHPEQVQKLQEECTRAWEMLELAGRQNMAQEQTQSQVDDIKKQLGL